MIIPELLKVTEFAERAHASRSTVLRDVESGAIDPRYVRRMGTDLRISSAYFTDMSLNANPPVAVLSSAQLADLISGVAAEVSARLAAGFAASVADRRAS